jgi:hypothetical protein
MTLFWLFVIATTLWMFFESRSFGYDKRDLQGLAAISPWGWFWGGMFFWLVAFPLYLASREKLRAAGLSKAGKDAPADVGVGVAAPVAAPVPMLVAQPPTSLLTKVGGSFIIGCAGLAMVGAIIGPKGPTPDAPAPVDPLPVALAADEPTIAQEAALGAVAIPADAPAPEPAAALPEGRLPLRMFADYVAKSGDNCEDAPMGEGKPRILCRFDSPTPGIFEAIGPQNALQQVSLTATFPNDAPAESIRAMGDAMMFFTRIAGKPIGHVSPKKFIAKLSDKTQTFVHEGIRYTTTPVMAMGMIVFSAELR